MTAELLFPRKDRCYVNPGRHEEKPVTQLDLFFGRRKTPGPHPVEHGRDQMLVRHTPHWKTEIRDVPGGFNRQTYIHSAHEAGVLCALLVINFLNLGKESEQLLFQHLDRPVGVASPFACHGHP
jgi:hypothetical protein